MHEVLDQLANELFRTFARFEYALKATGFYQPTQDDAKLDWTDFARSVSGALNNPADTGLREAIEYILEYPPRKQVIQDETLGWTDALPTGNRSDRVLILVRRIRNNLFHGGKFSGQWFDAARSERLLRHSLTILRGCLEAPPVVRDAYYGHDEWHT